MTQIVKFADPRLSGYGFDIIADRVVRFNKHPDGTYMNTRSTYYINKAQFTHFDLRTIAIKQSAPVVKARKTYWVYVVILAALIVFSLSECSVNLNLHINQTTQGE